MRTEGVYDMLRIGLFDFCIMHDCALDCHSPKGCRDVNYFFRFPDGYKFLYTIVYIDLVEIDHRVLEAKMIDTVESSYNDWLRKEICNE